IEAGAAQYLNPDIHRCGGFSEMMKIAHLAAAWDIKIAPHLVPELSISVLVSIPNAAVVESLAGAPEGVWEHDPVIVDGHMEAPDRPGHGMAFSAQALKEFTVDG
ncbi:MAG: enolase C-terminal domain-like protein, partial [Alphaproteobacteria bacterium]